VGPRAGLDAEPTSSSSSITEAKADPNISLMTDFVEGNDEQYVNLSATVRLILQHFFNKLQWSFNKLP
jgi:hypothetical protein